MREEDIIVLTVYAVIFGISFVVGLTIQAVICWLVSGCLKAIPERFREITPGKVWLNMIPCFSIIWNFFVFLGLARSFRRAFDELEDDSVGDCGEQLGLFYSISVCTFVVPCVNYITPFVALILLIIVLVKAFELKKKIVEAVQSGALADDDVGETFD